MTFQHVVRPWPASNGRALTPHFDNRGERMAKPNYHQARKQKEVARKARQQEKQQRRATRSQAPETQADVTPAQEPGGSPETGSENPT